jgi:uncharacterized membrane protein
MYARDYRHQAWNSLRGRWGMAILASIIAGLLTSAASFIPVCGSIIATGLISVGVAGVFMSIIHGEDTDVGRLFDGFQNNFVTNLIAGVLYNVFIALWTLLFIIPGIVKSYSYAMTFYVLREHPEMTATEAITESRRLMNGNKMRLFCLDLSFIGWYLLSCLTFGILLIWVLPYHEAAHAAFYESIKDN